MEVLWTRFLHSLILGAEAFALVPFAVALSRRRHIPDDFRPVFYYAVGLLAIWQLGWYGRVYLHNNLFCFHLTTVFQFSFLSLAYYRLIPRPTFRVVVRVCYGLFLLIALADALYFHKFMAANNLYARSFGNVLLIGYALYHILLLTNQVQPAIERRPEFLLAVAVIFYYSVPLLVTTLQDYFTQNYLRRGYPYSDLFIHLTLLPFVLSAWIAMTLLSFMFLCFPLDCAPREALPAWLRWRRKRPARRPEQPAPPAAAGPVTGVGAQP